MRAISESHSEHELRRRFGQYGPQTADCGRTWPAKEVWSDFAVFIDAYIQVRSGWSAYKQCWSFLNVTFLRSKIWKALETNRSICYDRWKSLMRMSRSLHRTWFEEERWGHSPCFQHGSCILGVANSSKVTFSQGLAPLGMLQGLIGIGHVGVSSSAEQIWSLGESQSSLGWLQTTKSG